MMQPTFFPWAGYFNLMVNADYFVFLDDAQFCRGTWHQRNRILNISRTEWLTVPVKSTGKQEALDCTQISQKDKLWQTKQKNLVYSVYRSAPYFSDVAQMLEFYYDAGNLADLNIGLIEPIAKKLEINTKIYRASHLNVDGARTERLVKLVDCLNCAQYLTPVGAVDYLREDQFAKRSSAQLLVQDFQPTYYPQLNASEFISHLSIIDVVANLGWAGAAHYIRQGHFIPEKDFR